MRHRLLTAAVIIIASWSADAQEIRAAGKPLRVGLALLLTSTVVFTQLAPTCRHRVPGGCSV